MSDFAISSDMRPSTIASPVQAEGPFRMGLIQVFFGWLLGLFPLVPGLLLATWGTGFFQAFGVVVMASAPAFGLIIPLMLLASGLSRWVWIGALVGCLTSALLDGAIMAWVLFAS